MKKQSGRNKRADFWRKSILGVVTSLVMISLYVMQAEALKRVERGVYDIYLRNSSHEEPSGIPVIIDIDEKSLEEYGQWPWPRYILGDMLLKLADNGAAAVALDVILSEEDRTSPEKIARSLIGGVDIDIKLSHLPETLRNYDKYLASAIQESPSVLGFYAWTAGAEERYDKKPRSASIVWQAQNERDEAIESGTKLIQAKSANFPIATLYTMRTMVGFTNATADPDGIIRSVPLLMKLDGGIYPSLALSTVMQAKGIKTIIVNYDDDIEHIKLGEYIIPVDGSATILVPFKGPKGSYKYYSAKDLLDDKLTEAELKDKIVFIGSSAIGLQDIRSTPWDEMYPGVEVHASVVDSILGGNYILQQAYFPGIHVLSIFFFGIFSAFLFGNTRPAIYLPIIAIVISAVSVVSFRLFEAGVFLSPVYVVFTIVVQAIAILGIRFWQEESRKRFIQNAFGKYVTPEVVKGIAERDDDFLKGQKKELSILFSDIRGFTTLSEDLDPQQVVELLNEYFTPMTAIIRKHGGTTDKFIGDAIMAFWNAPLDVEKHACGAVESAIQMHSALKNMNPAIKIKYGFEINMGVGIHSGWAYVGNMGSQEMQNYTVIGDNVNIASRLEGLCKEYGEGVVLSSDTVELCAKECSAFGYKFMLIDSIIVKGRHNALDIYAPVPSEEYLKMEEELEEYEKARQAYVDGYFDDAEKLFDNLRKKYARKLYKIYYERSLTLSLSPPANWEGVWIFDTK